MDDEWWYAGPTMSLPIIPPIYAAAAKAAAVPDYEVVFRYSAFEVMNLAFAGRQTEAEAKLAETNRLYAQLPKTPSP